ncbi:hypothetical protein HDU97_000645 [Phlyctochytrium planicorne]|nr:hypothetical protein HDU97_000645 [Phlyctochytrium planicorne]
MVELKVLYLTKKGFAPFGEVISVEDPTSGFAMANQGTARRFNYITDLVNLRPKENGAPAARANVCVFRCSPFPSGSIHIKLLERHQFSTQMFIPMSAGGNVQYLVIVAENDPVTDKPNFETLTAFMGSSTQGFNYRPNVWHHPMIALSNEIDFVCIVHERNEQQLVATEDTEEIQLEEEIIIRLP